MSRSFESPIPLGGHIGIGKRVLAAALAAAICQSIHLAASSPALASGDCYGDYHYSGEAVVQSGYGGWYYAPSCIGPYYDGWIAINGQVTVPSSVPFIGISTTHNHSAGWLGINMQANSYLQEGWFTGCGVNYCRYGSIGYYTEVQNGTVAPIYYSFTDWGDGSGTGDAPLGGSTIFQIEYVSSGIWDLYFNYNQLKVQTPSNLPMPISGSPAAMSETLSTDGSVVGMPLTYYGYSNPNTNNALRIKGARGYVPWTASLSSGQTAYYDEQYGQSGCNQPGNPACAYYYFGVDNSNYYVYAED